MPFKKGQKRPPNAGKKKGNKHGYKKAGDLYSSLLDKGCDFDQIFANALMTKDHQMIKVMIDAMPFLRPRYKEREAPAEETPQDTEIHNLTLISESDLLKSVSNE
jgi:hypothetical protein